MKRIIICLISAVFLSGCQTPTATIELINIGRKALEQSGAEKELMFESRNRMYQNQLRALDSGFDADVKLVAAGGIKKSDGKVVALTPEWIISARKGYSAARGQIETQMLQAQKNNIIEQDNISAGKEALNMAADLVIMQWNISEQFKAQFKKYITKEQNDGK